MAGDWIKFELATLDKPEVCQLADLANIDMDAVVGKLLRVWGWFDQHTENGNAPSVSKRLLDRLVGVTGFCDFMKSVGWMFEDDGVISLPRFDRHNGKTAKNRLLTAKRVASHKASKGKGNAKGNGASVSDALPREDLDVEKKEQEQEPPLPPKGESAANASAEVQSGSPNDQPKAKAPKTSRKFDPLTACPPNVSPEVWAKWVLCRKEQGKPLKQTTCEAQAEQLANHPNPDEVIRRSIAGGWQGLFPDRVTAGNVHHLPNSRHHGFEDRDYFAGLTQREDGTYAL
ncbi:hypothetical protein D9M70_389440 [compost metagenome]